RRGTVRGRPRAGLEHLHPALPHCEAAEREAVERQADDALDRSRAERRVRAPLRDPEAELARRPRRVDLPLRPELRAPDGLLVLAQRDVRRWADVEAHGDVRPKPALDLVDALGREALLAAVVDRAERDAVVV